MNRRLFIIGAALLPFVGCARGRISHVTPSLKWAEMRADLEWLLPKLMAEEKVPGLSIAVIQDAKEVWRRGFGVKDAATGEPVDDGTLFEAGSMSKALFAYAALKLCERGVIGLDIPIAKFAPEPFLTGDPRLDRITPRHLLSHSGGFQNMRSGELPLKIHFEPGSQYLYSGEGYYYLQSVITHLLGRVDRRDCAQFEAGLEVCATDFEEFMAENILRPFGMRASGYLANGARNRLAATGHDENGKPLPKNKSTGPAVARYGAVGGLSTTPSDFAKFMIEVLSPKRPDAHRLKPETIAEMLRPHAKVLNGPYTSSWALGWQVQDNGLINHGGDNKGFHSHAIASPTTKAGYVIMTNAEGGPALIQKLFAHPVTDRLLGV